MKKYLLPQNGNFYKANLHCHTTVSDGRKTPLEIKELYQNMGYSIVAYTDHDILIPHNELTDDSFLALNGFEAGVDDNHNAHATDTRMSDSGKAYTVIKAEKLEYRTITKALENGDFYASERPEIFELWYEGEKVYIKCSDADRILCNYQIRKAEVVYSENEPVTEACFNVPSNCGYFRITVIDRNGKHACTNAYFVENI